MLIHVIQDKGNHTYCEDSVICGHTVICGDSHVDLKVTLPFIVAACDGIGGISGGRYASSFVCDRLRNLDLSKIESEKNLKDEFKKINADLLDFALTTSVRLPDEASASMGTTVAGLLFLNSATYIFWAGNTRVYSLDNNQITQLTVDHVDPYGKLTSVLGGGEEMYLSELVVKKIKYMESESFIITTDGIHDHMDNPEKAMEKCVDIPDAIFNYSNSEDDRTMVVIHN